MNETFWKQFPPIPGFDAVEMKRKAQHRIYETTKDMTDAELIEYFGRTSRIFHETGKIPPVESGHLVARETSPNYGGTKPDARKKS